MRGRGKVVGFSEEVLDTLLQETTYRLQKSFLLLSLLHFDDTVRYGVNYQQDHIFPQDRLNADKLVDEHGFDRDRAEQYEDARNRIANLQLLTDQENSRKQEMPFEEWISIRTDDYCRNHCIPEQESLYRLENFFEFLESREGLIRSEMISRFEQFTEP